MNDLDTQVDLLEQEVFERLLTAQLATTSVIRQTQEKIVERLGRLIDDLKNAQAPSGSAVWSPRAFDSRGPELLGRRMIIAPELLAR